MYTVSCPAPQVMASDAPSAKLSGVKVKGWY